MKAEMKIAVQGEHNDPKFRKVIEDLESIGWKVDREYGGKTPNYKGHGAELSKEI